ncbi:hypothetical protein CBR_g49999 [Chara braunii]|uniref:Uncharacterized protein n=1 Tax=Chara braunii TaxID=69332 RepID=A0A388K581_CHABU|nr:hypothetical protein CBR_g49999 [Chara braunii]|eukprot:GBG65207.1 hypothetical protein CBR_g49999 [Chara braunii]
MEALQATTSAICSSGSWLHSGTHAAAANTTHRCSRKESSSIIPGPSTRLMPAFLSSSSSASSSSSSLSSTPRLQQVRHPLDNRAVRCLTDVAEERQHRVCRSTHSRKRCTKPEFCGAMPRRGYGCGYGYGSTGGSGSARLAATSALGAAVQGEEKACAQTLAGTFADLKKSGTPAFIPFIMAGQPSLEVTEAALLALDANGADIIELGVPYSDPLADGPVIHAAATHALEKGTTMDCVFTILKKVVPKLKAPIVLFTYFNPILKRGVENFLEEVRSIGVTGLVIPDLPLEETLPIAKLTSLYGLELVLLVTPTTPLERMRAIAAASQGFVYLVSVTGVTGARTSVASGVEKMLQQLKQVTDKPVAVGFGISTPEHAEQVVGWGAEGVIVGSAIVRVLQSAATLEDAISETCALASSIKAGSLRHRVAAP